MSIIGTPVTPGTLTPTPTPTPPPQGGEVFGDVFGPDPVTQPNTVAKAIEQAAIDGVASVSVDGTTTTRMSVNDQIAADRYASTKRAAGRPLGGLRVSRIVGNSAV